ncbi:MAG: hypothetical protein IJL26_00340 [Clostridia bacterium]|nr:hypothetical protein [Clostridia bacterium]
MKISEKKKYRPTKTDLAALLVFCALAALLLTGARHAPVGEDESFYYVTALRLLRSDRMFIDEWHLTQTSALFQMLPLALYTTLTKSTDGALLFMRYVFIAADLLICFYACFKLKPFGAWTAILATTLFASDLFAGIYALNYYNMAIRFALLTGILLFLPQKHPRLQTAIAGVTLSCAVISQPILAFVYLAFSLLVLITELTKKAGKPIFIGYSFVLNGKTWRLLTCGIFGSAAAFLLYLCFSVKGSLGELSENIPQMLHNSEYVITSIGNIYNHIKPKILLDTVGAFPLAAMAFLAVAAWICDRARGGRTVRGIIFLLTQGCFTAAVLHGYRSMLHCAVYPVTMLGLTAYLLCREKDRHVFAFWILAALCGLAVDYSSNATILYGSRIAYVPAVYFSIKTIRELREPGADKKRASKGIAVISAILAGVMLFSVCGYISTLTNSFAPVVRSKENVRTLDAGPLRGIVAGSAFAAQYRNVLKDLDRIKGTQGRFYVAALFPYAYLYADRPIGTYSSFYIEADSEDRLLRYWEMHPENRPQTVYLPVEAYVSGEDAPERYPQKYIDEKLAFFRSLGSCEVTEGFAGLIVNYD